MGDCLCHFVCPKHVSQEVMILTCTWQILGLNLSQDTGCPDEVLLWFSSVSAGSTLIMPGPLPFKILSSSLSFICHPNNLCCIVLILIVSLNNLGKETLLCLYC
jgi:hypothetical protein